VIPDQNDLPVFVFLLFFTALRLLTGFFFLKSFLNFMLAKVMKFTNCISCFKQVSFVVLHCSGV